MPRRARIQLDRVPLHIVQRGHNREACFFGYMTLTALMVPVLQNVTLL